tara:strand:- start:38303 stop:38611 length:309 start_codon:yes stop_codon:yes gene_type:complete
VGTCYKTKRQNPFRLLAEKAKSHLPLNKLQNFNLKISEGEGTRTKQNKITIINYSPPCKGGVARLRDGVGTRGKTKSSQKPLPSPTEKVGATFPLNKTRTVI